MSRFLLDVNVVLAVLDPKHVFHDAAHAWMQNNRRSVFLTSPLVQNGVMRVASQPAYPNPLGTTSAVREVLAEFCSRERHEFCPDDVSLLETGIVASSEALTPARLTDLYLLALAVAHDAKLATFDRRLPAAAIRGGSRAVELVPI